MPDQTVTDDDRDALDLANMIEKNPHSYSDTYRGAARAIRAHVPAPPATLADELRAHAKWEREVGATGHSADLYALADRVEAVEKDNISVNAALCTVTDERDEARAEVVAKEDEATQECHRAYRERDEARAEVDRLTSLNAEKNTRIQEQGREIGEYISALNARTSGRTSKESLPVALTDPADVPAGEVWEVTVAGHLAAGYRDSTGSYPWSVIFAEEEFSADNFMDRSVTLVARLVPDVRRVIDRPEDLDKLPAGSIVLDGDGDPWKKSVGGHWYLSPVSRSASYLLDRYGPVTVIHEPEVTA